MCRIENDLLGTPNRLKDTHFWEEIGRICVEKFFGEYVSGEGKNFEHITDIFSMSIAWICSDDNGFNSDGYDIFHIAEKHDLGCKIIVTDKFSVNEEEIKMGCYKLFETALISECASVIKRLFYFLDEYTVEYLSNIIVEQAYQKATSDLKAYLLYELSVDVDIFSALSRSKYEKRSCDDFNLIFVGDVSQFHGLNEFCDVEINRRNIRQIRKLLELLNKKNKQYCLVFDKKKSRIVGIADMPKNLMQGEYKLVISNGCWSLYNNRNKLFCEYVEHDFKAVRVDMKIYNLSPDIKEAISIISNDCHHGALIFVFPDSASVEDVVNDLDRRGRIYKLSKPVSSKELLSQFCEIDGAIYLDHKGICYGFGGICDGAAKEKGTMARGARYNAAITAVHSYTAKPLAVIISEDGGIDCKYSQGCELIRSSENYCSTTS